ADLPGLRPAKPRSPVTPAHLRTLPRAAPHHSAALLPAVRRSRPADRAFAGPGVQRMRGLARLAPHRALRLPAAPTGGPPRPPAQVPRLARARRTDGGSDGRGPPARRPG